MRRMVWRPVVLAMLILTSMAAGSEEAVLSSGRRVEGTLSRDAQGRLVFTPSGNKAPIPSTQIQDVRFPTRPVKPLLTAAYHRITLHDGQALTGEILGLNADQLRLRTGWARELTLPRGAIASISQPGNLATVWIEDFEADLKDWKLNGNPPFGDGDSAPGKRGLLLNAAGQTAERVLSSPLPAGRFNLAFRLPDKIAGLRWLLEMEFQAKGEPRTVRVELGGEGPNYAVEAPGESEKVPPVPRSTGWSRLDVEFQLSALVVTVDGLAVWYDRHTGPGGALSRVRLLCVAEGKGTPQGAVAFDEVGLAALVTPLRHSVSDSKQDEVWLSSGDGLFGNVVKADRRQITLQIPSGDRVRERTFGWSEVRGLFLGGDALPRKNPEGEVIRLVLRREIGTESDQIEGVVRGLDDKHLTLSHPLLGELKINRERIDRLRWLKD